MCDDYSCVESYDYCTCSEGDIVDCNGNCCPESWIGDGYCSDGNGWSGCDLTCYGCDGGDCPEDDPECEELDDCCSPGDFNCDYSINVLDIVSIVDCILNGTDCPCGDLNGDGSVNVLDIVQLVNMILGNN